MRVDEKPQQRESQMRTRSSGSCIASILTTTLIKSVYINTNTRSLNVLIQYCSIRHRIKEHTIHTHTFNGGKKRKRGEKYSGQKKMNWELIEIGFVVVAGITAFTTVWKWTNAYVWEGERRWKKERERKKERDRGRGKGLSTPST